MRRVLSVTEDVMQRIRMVSAALLAAIALAMAATASSQAATTDQAGQPMALLAGLSPPHTAKPTAAAKKASTNIKKSAVRKHAAKNAKNATKHAKLKSKKHYRIAAADTAEPAPPPSTPVPPAAVWPLADAAAPADSAPIEPPEPAPSDATTPSTVVVGGQTVQVAASEEVNQIDLAADDETATVAARFDGPDAAPAARTALAAPVHEDGSQNQSLVGSASWFAQVLAALGGAFTAGTVAWFLIGSGPMRTYE
jgi:hypothetical protein